MKDDLLVTTTLRLHQLNCQPEQSSRLVPHHLEIVIFRRTGQGIAPEEIHSLSAMEVEEFLGVNLDGAGIMQLMKFTQRAEVDIVGRIQGLGDAEDAVRYWDAASEDGGVLHVVDTEVSHSAWPCVDNSQTRVIGRLQ